MLSRHCQQAPCNASAMARYGPGARANWRWAGTTEAYASPSVSNIEAAMASVTDLPAHTTNWNAG